LAEVLNRLNYSLSQWIEEDQKSQESQLLFISGQEHISLDGLFGQAQDSKSLAAKILKSGLDLIVNHSDLHNLAGQHSRGADLQNILQGALGHNNMLRNLLFIL